MFAPLGDVDTMINKFQKRLPHVSYLEVAMVRQQWLRQRSELSRDSEGNHVVHYFTYANKHDIGLHRFLFIATLHGIGVTVG
jgi:hypothetical protein